MFAKRLFDFYPPQEAGNPEVVLTGVVELFEHYPAEVVERTVSPVFGLPAKHKFMPRIAEIKEFLDAQMPPPEPTRVYPVLPGLPPPDRSTRPSYQELVDRCARDGLMIGKKKKLFGEREIAEFRQANNISDEAWNAIPDAK